MKSLSDNSLDKSNTASSDWEPLVPGQEKSFQMAISKNKTAQTLDEKVEFKPLYEGKGQHGSTENFELIYSKDRKAESTLSPSPGGSTDKQPDAEQAPAEPTPEENLAQIQKQAHEKGFSQGKQEGYEAGMQEAKQMVESIAQIMTSTENLWQSMVERYENEIIELVKRISEKVIYGHARIDNQIVKRAILKSFELIPDPIEATINVSAEDYEFMETAKEELFEQVKTLKNVSIVSDPSLTRGGCRVETKSGEVDSDIQGRLDAISKSIIDAAAEMADNQ